MDLPPTFKRSWGNELIFSALVPEGNPCLRTQETSSSVSVVVWMRMNHMGSKVWSWSPVGQTVWEGSGGLTWLEDVCHWGQVSKAMCYTS